MSVDGWSAFFDIPPMGNSMNVTHVFAANVRLYRKRLGLSQEAFAERCHLHRTYISLLERERRNISLKNVQAIANALDIEPYRLFIPPEGFEGTSRK